MRYFFEISYKGTNYHGWQIQENAISIQETIQAKLKKLLQSEIEIVGSGRTDTGVHANQQYFHADINQGINCVDFCYHLNAILPRDISVRSICIVPGNAHARYDAISRQYKYVMIRHKDPFLVDEAYLYHRFIDIEYLNETSKLLIGRHNFKSFSKVQTQVNNFICEIFMARWEHDNGKVIFALKANRFLRGMVRAIVGTLLLVNEGKLNPESLNEILLRQDRRAAGRAVPPEGLYLSEIIFPQSIFKTN